MIEKNKSTRVYINRTSANTLLVILGDYLFLSFCSILAVQNFSEIDLFFTYNYDLNAVFYSAYALVIVFFIAKSLVINKVSDFVGYHFNLFVVHWVFYILIFTMGISVALISIYFYGLAGRGEAYLNEQNPLLRLVSNLILWFLLLTTPKSGADVRKILIYILFVTYAAAFSRAAYGLMALCFGIYSGLNIVRLSKILVLLLVVGAVRLENLNLFESLQHSLIGLILTPLATPKFVQALNDGFMPDHSLIYSKFLSIYTRLSGDPSSQQDSMSWALATWISPTLTDLGYAIGFSPAAELILILSQPVHFVPLVLFYFFILYIYKFISKISYYIYFLACAPQIIFYMRSSVFDLLPIHLLYASIIFFILRILSVKKFD